MKGRYELLRMKFVMPVMELKEMYEYSSTSIDNNLLDRNVLKCFERLDNALQKQLRLVKKESESPSNS